MLQKSWVINMKKQFDQNILPSLNDLNKLGVGDHLSPDQAAEFAGRFFTTTKSSFYEQFLNYVLNADELAIKKLNSFLVLVHISEKSLERLEKQIPPVIPRPHDAVTTEDFMILAKLKSDGLNDLCNVMRDKNNIDILAKQPLEEFFKKQVVIHHAQAHHLNDDINFVYESMLKSLKTSSFVYHLAYSDEDDKMTSFSEESFSSFEEASKFWSKTMAKKLQELPQPMPKSIHVVSVLEGQKLPVTADLNIPSGYISSQKIAASKSGTFESLFDQPKKINPNSQVGSYYSKLEKLEKKIEQLTQRSWIWRFLERVFGNPELTAKKTQVLLDIKNKLVEEHATLLNGTKKISELIHSKLDEPSIKNSSTNAVPTWGDVIATSSFSSNKPSKTKELLDEIDTPDVPTPHSR
jgi:hypothetical protein